MSGTGDLGDAVWKALRVIIVLLIVLILVIGYFIVKGCASEHSLSVSMRECILETLPFDYEYRYSYKAKTTRFNILYEREVGLTGMGLDYFQSVPILIELNNKKLVTDFTWYMRKVKNIDYQDFSTTYPTKYKGVDLKVGISANMNEWNDAKLLLAVRGKYKDFFNFSASTNFVDRRIYSCELSKRYYIGPDPKNWGKKKYSQALYGGKMFIAPKLLYRMANGNDFWWVKLTGGVVFK